MPYADLPVNRAIMPLKKKDYLDTGRPVVARDLPESRPWGDCLDLAGDAGAFSRLVRERVATGVPGGQAAARSRLGGEGGAVKAEQFALRALGDQPRAPPDLTRRTSGHERNRQTT